MSDRGPYRGVYSALVDDPDFQHLPAHARLVLYTLRLCRQAGPGVIFRYYPEILCRQTGLPVQAVHRAMRTLQAQHWIDYDDVIVWVRNGLKYDPHVRLADSHHLKAIEKQLRELPRRQVILNFCDYYGIARPFDGSAMGPAWVQGESSTPPCIHIAPPTDSENARNYPSTDTGGASAGRADPPPTPPGVQFRIPQDFLDALERAPKLGRAASLRRPAFWQAQLRAHPGVEFPDEILKAEAWLIANSKRHIRDYPRFLHSWFARAYADQEATE